MENSIVESTLINHPCNYIIINYSLLNWELLSNQLTNQFLDIHTIDYHPQLKYFNKNDKLIV